jgi:hypothetical protein
MNREPLTPLTDDERSELAALEAEGRRKVREWVLETLEVLREIAVALETRPSGKARRPISVKIAPGDVRLLD